jgi:chemotaxis protein CheX
MVPGVCIVLGTTLGFFIRRWLCRITTPAPENRLSKAAKPLNGSRAPVVSSVQIVGERQGAVRLDISPELARRTCANLTGVDAGDLSQEDVRDAAGELANMVGGSVKAMCAHTSRLSLPAVAMGRDFAFSLCQGTVIQTLSFSHTSGFLTVSVIEKQRNGRVA